MKYFNDGVFLLTATLLAIVACAENSSSEAVRIVPAEKIEVGINLAGVRDYSSELPFVDAMKMSRPWVSQHVNAGWGKGPELELDEFGWIRQFKPGQYAETLMLHEIDGHYPAGEYVCLYDGEGAIDFRGDAQVYSRDPGRIVLKVNSPSDSGIRMQLRKTNPDNYVRNIRVILPGHEATYKEQPFRKEFLERWASFKFIRFMDWMGTNQAESTTWESRPKVNGQTQANHVALEHMIQLCNELKVDAWFCIPHTAADDYIREFARMVHRDLDPSLKVYVEHSNEVWNMQFGQAKHATRRGQEMGLSDDDTKARMYYHALRTKHIVEIWNEVYGEDRDRLVRVLGSQSANSWLTQIMLEYEDIARHVDVVAIAPYFGGSLGNHRNREATSRMTVDQVLDACSVEMDKVRNNVHKHMQHAQPRGLRVIAYEAGQHLAAHHAGNLQGKLDRLFIDANRHPRMKEIYRDYLQTWKSAGGHEIAMFSSMYKPGRYGMWGLLEHENEDPETVPKYQAVMEFIQANE